MAGRAHSFPFVVAASVGLVLLMAAILGWLGWRLLSQEEALDRQRFRDRLEQAADTQLAGFLRTLADTEAWLGQMGTALPTGTDARAGGHAVLIMFSTTRVYTQPAGVLPYLPAAHDRDGSGRDGLYRISTTGGGPQRLGDYPTRLATSVMTISRDGRRFVMHTQARDPQASRDYWMLDNFLPVAGSSAPAVAK